MSDAGSVYVSGEDRELRQFAQQVWATDEYRAWHDSVARAVADGTIYQEPALDGSSSGE